VGKEPIAFLSRNGSRYELNYPDYGLTIRGPYVEWVLEAAADIIARFEKTRMESVVEELTMLKEFGDESTSDIAIEQARYEANTRFETVPQCVVTMNEMDYRWVQGQSRKEGADAPMERLHDMSLTRNNTFLVNQH
jgi:hypothetical protein